MLSLFLSAVLLLIMDYYSRAKVKTFIYNYEK